jgi:hypothetical protein
MKRALRQVFMYYNHPYYSGVYEGHHNILVEDVRGFIYPLRIYKTTGIVGLF